MSQHLRVLLARPCTAKGEADKIAKIGDIIAHLWSGQWTIATHENWWQLVITLERRDPRNFHTLAAKTILAQLKALDNG